jgi:hypothetical protein
MGQERTAGGMGRRKKEANSAPSDSLDLSAIRSADPSADPIFPRRATLNIEAN